MSDLDLVSRRMALSADVVAEVRGLLLIGGFSFRILERVRGCCRRRQALPPTPWWFRLHPPRRPPAAIAGP